MIEDTMVDRKFAKWTVSCFSHVKHYHKYWDCMCECGLIYTIREYALKSGRSKGCISCGQKGKDYPIKHGLARNPIYAIWQGMIGRCYRKNNKQYFRYGGRGIRVCKRWHKLENFYEDMGDRPKGLSLDRINNNKGYSKSNCRWATRWQQANNTRSNHIIKCDGEVKTIADWARYKNMNYGTLLSRINRGWPIDKAINHPVS